MPLSTTIWEVLLQYCWNKKKISVRRTLLIFMQRTVWRRAFWKFEGSVKRLWWWSRTWEGMTPRLVTMGNRRGYKELTEVLMHRGKTRDEETRMYWALYGFPRSTTVPPQPKNSLSPPSSKRDAVPAPVCKGSSPSPPHLQSHLPPHPYLSSSCHRGWWVPSHPGLPTSLLGHLDSLSYWLSFSYRVSITIAHRIIRICISDD